MAKFKAIVTDIKTWVVATVATLAAWFTGVLDQVGAFLHHFTN